MPRLSRVLMQSAKTKHRIAIVLLFVVATAGCFRFSPKTTALKQVHKTYRTEFAEFMVPPPGADPQLQKPAANEPAFAGTLQAIREYRTKYGEDSQEAAHLKVLEGMIYLESGRLGMARLIKPDVQNAQSKLKSGTGRYTRDELLAKCFGHLVDGWQEINDFNDNDDATIAEHAKLEPAADGIKDQVEKLAKPMLAQPEVDEGAIYLATTAAIFYVWVFKLKSDAGLPEVKKSIWFKKGSDLIGDYLSDSEKTAATGATETKGSQLGRLRYLDWYGFLVREAGRQ
ncbi:MAG: hypothetical protein WAU45_08790 [Blastocatellia bacterium]